jgi:hypothetical protein
VESYVTSKMPGQNKINCTTVDPVELDVVISATLPLPEIAGGARRAHHEAIRAPHEQDEAGEGGNRVARHRRLVRIRGEVGWSRLESAGHHTRRQCAIGGARARRSGECHAPATSGKLAIQSAGAGSRRQPGNT